jgi:hypothetical protein
MRVFTARTEPIRRPYPRSNVLLSVACFPRPHYQGSTRLAGPSSAFPVSKLAAPEKFKAKKFASKAQK